MIKIGEYTIVNEDKFERAVNGVIGGAKGGQLIGGVGKDATDAQKLAEYDKLGGLIRKGDNKVKTGSFWDIKEKKMREKPEVILIFRDIEGNYVELGENETKPIEIVAAEKIAKKKIEAVKEENKKGRKKKDDE